MRNLLLGTAAILTFADRPDAADDVWSCSFIQEGEPHVIKIKVDKSTASMSNCMTRLIDKFGSERATKDALKTLAVWIDNEAWRSSEVSLDSVVINKSRRRFRR